VRFCQPCLTLETISSYRIETANVPKEHWVRLPHMTKEMYNPYGRSGYRDYTLTLYMRRDIDRVVKTLYGDATFEAFAQRKEEEANRHREETARLVAAQNAEREVNRANREKRMRDMIGEVNGNTLNLEMSTTFARNANLHSTLDEQAFVKKIPGIVQEVKDAMEKKAIEAEQRKRIVLEEKNERERIRELHRAREYHLMEQFQIFERDVDGPKRIQCGVCHRFFTSVKGASDHFRAKHDE
jgi:hypothetical protein